MSKHCRRLRCTQAHSTFQATHERSHARFVAEALAVHVAAVAVGAATDDIALIMGISGAVTVSVLMLALPALFYLRVFPWHGAPWHRSGGGATAAAAGAGATAGEGGGGGGSVNGDGGGKEASSGGGGGRPELAWSALAALVASVVTCGGGLYATIATA